MLQHVLIFLKALQYICLYVHAYVLYFFFPLSVPYGWQEQTAQPKNEQYIFLRNQETEIKAINMNN
jgi:hypothetical protein